MCGLKREGVGIPVKTQVQKLATMTPLQNGYTYRLLRSVHSYPPIFNCQCSYSNNKSKLFNYTHYTKLYPQCQEKIILNVLFFMIFLSVNDKK